MVWSKPDCSELPRCFMLAEQCYSSIQSIIHTIDTATGDQETVNSAFDANDAISTDDIIDVSMLNSAITLEEVQHALIQAKHKKAKGCDDIPMEVLKNGPRLHFLHKLFNFCFRLDNTPLEWYRR